MSYLFNNPADFADEFLDGFVAAHSDAVRPVPGGVARRSATPSGQVAVVIGGGSGHYPAFAGVVGPGLAHGAAVGGVFASPSAQRVHGVAKAVAGDAGVLLTYGNYAGDVLNFDEAERMLRSEGIPTRSLVVTDDIYSASPEERAKRRGIAGDVAVFKAAGWAAQQGRDLDGVWELANRANERTRSIGVAFGGCTLPGSDAPLFTVPSGRMAVGLGIHGEPGIDELDIPSAAGLAELLVGRLLAEAPADAGSGRVALILNGLGGVKYEELYLTYGAVARRLADAGLTVVRPEVGELVTSFEMAGLSLSLMWLDEELEESWRGPAWSPAYRTAGGAPQAEKDRGLGDLPDAETEEPIAPGGADSRASVGLVLDALAAAAATIDADAEELGRLDAIAGDGDHGIGMQRGATAALAAARATAERGAGCGTVLSRAGDAWADRAGGTSGALWGLILRAVGAAIGDQEAPTAASVAAGLRDGRDAVTRYGKAQLGDKTLYDALAPFVAELEAKVAGGASIAAAWADAAREATAAAQATAGLMPRLGRARPHQEKSLGTPDPGAVSLAAIATAIAGVLLSTEMEHV
jgi:dihydroxyacetone kinase